MQFVDPEDLRQISGGNRSRQIIDDPAADAECRRLRSSRPRRDHFAHRMLRGGIVASVTSRLKLARRYRAASGAPCRHPSRLQPPLARGDAGRIVFDVLNGLRIRGWCVCRRTWKLKPQIAAGYKVIFVPFSNGKPAGDPIDFATGFLTEDGKARGRPRRDRGPAGGTDRCRRYREYRVADHAKPGGGGLLLSKGTETGTA